MNILNLSSDVAESVLYSWDGSLISPGETYYKGEYHGKEALFTNSVGEKFLGLRQFSDQQRKDLAKKGYALSDGSYPIENCSDASNAIRAQGRGNASSDTIKAHIKKNVKRLGCSGQIFDEYK